MKLIAYVATAAMIALMPAAMAMTSVHHTDYSSRTGSDSSNASHTAPSHAFESGNGTTTEKCSKFLGGRHNETLPSLGGYRRHVALLLEERSEESDQLQGCIAVRITTKHFLTRASCLGESNRTLSIESSSSSGSADGGQQRGRHQLVVNKTTAHPDFAVNLAIVEVDTQDIAALPRAVDMILPLLDFSPTYYKSQADLSFVSLDNLFNPSLAENPLSIDGLIRVPVASCQYGSDDSAVNCYAPSDLASREMAFEFGQGMMLWKNSALVGLPDCQGLCSGGMFYSTTHLAKFRSWIDHVTKRGARWLALTAKRNRVQPVAPEQEPTFVSLYAHLGSSEPACGGSLIAPRYVVTTASCVANRTLSLARVSHGERPEDRLLTGEEDAISIESVHLHPQFGANQTQFSNDVAIIQLSAPTIYTPTLLASQDALSTTDNTTQALDSDGDGDESCKPRLSSVDSSFTCLPDPSSCDGADAAADTIERWNRAQGDSVFVVPSIGSYYLLGLSHRQRKDTSNATTFCPVSKEISVGDEVDGDDSNAKSQAEPVIRLATVATMEFIDAISVDHTWRNPHQLPRGIMANMRKRVDPQAETTSVNGSTTTTATAFSVANYDGPLIFDEPPKNLDLGFVVGLRFDKYGQNYCGGSLIASSYVLTAAHCVGNDKAKYVSVGSQESAGAETELIAVKKAHVTTHPLFGKRSLYSYDVAILELESQAYPKPIVLDNTRTLTASTYLTLLGYGADSATSNELSKVLRTVDLPYFPRDKCKKMFPELDESMFCAGGELARDACTGDSGSPLVKIVNGKPLQVGVVSSGRNGCGTPGVPGVYALVAEMQPFIDSVVAGDSWVKTTSVRSAGDSDSSGSRTSGEAARPSSATGAASPSTNGTTTTTTSSSVVLRSSALNMTDLPFEIINMATGAVEHQLSVIELNQETPNRLQAAVMQFLVGDYSHVAGWTPKIDQKWKISFYSTGDLTGLMQVMVKHKSNPLYARKSRFPRPMAAAGSSSTSRMSCLEAH